MMANEMEESILRSLRKISRAIDLYSRKLAGEFNLTGPQLVCLKLLARGEPITPSELARQVSLSQATVCGILDRLEAKELVARERSTEDKRRVNVVVTVKGEALAGVAPSPLQETFARRLAGLPGTERESIEQTLIRVVEMMEADELEAAPMMASGPLLAEPSEVAEFLENHETPQKEEPK